jgi:hypothetical protein
MASLTLRIGATGATGVKNAPLTNAEIDTNFSNLNTEIATKLNTSSYTAADVLSKLVTVDGTGSNLDADLLDGLNAVSGATGASIVSRDSSGNFSSNAITATQLNSGNLYLGAAGTIVFEGSTDNTAETTLTVTDPTVDRTITLPNVSGTVITTGDTGSVTNTMLAGSIANDKLANNSITIDGTTIALGASGSITAADLTWSGTQTFIDNKLLVVDNVDTSKKLALQISNIATSTTRTLTAPDESGTIATREYVAGGAGAGSFTTLSASSTASLTGALSISNLITAGEKTTVSATAAASTIQYDMLTQSILYYTTNATGNWTINLRGNGSTTLNSVMAIGETRTITFLAAQGSPAFYQTGLTIDGAAVTPKWQNGVTPTSGNTSGIDVYVLAIVKTASATFTVLESSTKFA